MSIRYVIKDIGDIEVSEDGKELEVLFNTNDWGNVYVDIPIEMIVNRFDAVVRQGDPPAVLLAEEPLQIIYKNNKPYGIRDAGGFLFFFTSISKYTDQEERYREEIEEQYKLADYLLNALKKVGKQSA